MANIAIVFGALMTALGPTLFFLSKPETQSPTAFIPSGFGVALILCGVLAWNDKFRMHAMHVAALLGLIGLAIPAFMVTRALVGGADFEPVKHGGQITMAVLSGAFLALCIKSFIDVRMARKAKEAQEPKAP